jgi:DNA-binding MarR family transcriptional regulator
VGEQPWLTGSEVAARAGIDDPAKISRLLAQLSELGLVDSARDAHRKGTPKVWRLTDRGGELDKLVGGEGPKRERSLALALMWESGGRLSDPAVAALGVIAGERGLSNGAIAQRVGITDANSMSQVLARLARRGLIENNRNGGRHNSWAITASGQELENAIRQETPAPMSQSVVFDVLKEAGGRLNHRVVSVLGAIGGEPGLSNLEIAERVGVESKAHTSKLLARLARFGLIENQVMVPVPFEANAWRLTTNGRQLQTTLQHEDQSAAPGASRNGHGTNPTVERA